jgi:hypothetical protein
MNNILDNLFYKEKLGIGNRTTFIKNVRERHPEFKIKDIQEYLKNQEVNQINTTVNKTYEYKITAPPRTFQIDIFWWRRGDTLIPILLLVDILSRKAWAYVLTKSKQEKRADVSVKTLQEFQAEVGFIKGLEGDNDFSSAAIKKFCNDNDMRLDTSVNLKYQYKITAPPRTFQIDIFWWKKAETLIPILLFVDILSRKAWAYVLTKSKKEKRAEVSVKTIQEFKDEVGLIRGLEGDNEFSSAAIKTFCNDNDIRLDTSVAKEEHISNGNKLGIIDRLVRTLRELIEKYFDITGHRTDNLKDVMKTVIDTYNNSNHRTLNNKSPDQVFKDNDDQIARHIADKVHNQRIYKSVPFADGLSPENQYSSIISPLSIASKLRLPSSFFSTSLVN